MRPLGERCTFDYKVTMDFSRLTASLALTAYLLGGWLLPALHRHTAHTDHQACTHSHRSAEAAGQHTCDQGPSSCCHEATSHSLTSSRSANNDGVEPGQGLINPRNPIADCEGLCVLCQQSVRKFSAANRRADTWSPVGNIQTICVADERLCRSFRLAIDGPRGPPARLG